MTVHQAKGLEFEHVILADLSQERQGDGAPIVHARELGFVFAPERRAGTDPDCGKASRTLKSEVYRTADASLREEQQAEMRRLLYVATTRAREKLTFVSTEGAKTLGFARVLNAWSAKAVDAGVMKRLAESELGEVRAPSRDVVVIAAPVAAEPVVAKRKKAIAESSVVPGQLSLFGVADDGEAKDREPMAEDREPKTDGRDRRSVIRDPSGLRDLRVTSAPAGTRFVLSVTDLENAIAPADATQAQFRRSAAWSLDVSLDPLARGRLTHMVLAAMHRLHRHPSLDRFINAELRICGYDPDDPRLVDVRDDIQAFLTSPLGREVSQLPPEARRHEMPFVLPFTVGSYTATVSGQIDLVYWSGSEPVIVDYKHAHAASTPTDAYAVQLDAYALAIARLCGTAGPIRTRLVFLRDRAAVRDRVVTEAMRVSLHHQVESVVRNLAVFPYEQRAHRFVFG